MSLVEYRRKRRFDQTNEPEPGKALPQGQRAIFVVQLHHASRRHYDFRLQIGDALKSWAVPKGPSYDPKVKRMAVEVEDHPVDYASFEGEIPKGQYGGGHVAQFDHGVWATQGDPEAQLAKGHLRFELFGTKLKGGWHLVRSGKPARQPQWLLFKDDDAYASDLEADDLLADVSAAPTADIRRAGGGKADKKKLKALPAKRARRKNWAKKALALPKAKEAAPPSGPFEPQLAKLGEAPPQGDQRVHEIKWDGYRILATVADGAVRLWSRNALEWTDKIPEIRDAVAELGLTSAALDGELIAGSGTKEDFNLLQATLSGERQGALAYALFDLLHIDGVDVAAAPLLERKALLQELLAGQAGHLAFSSHVQGDGNEAYRLAGEQHFEGIISKRADRGYTKQDVWDYYSAVMDHLLPEVINRPLSIIRCPAGTGKPCFFQKHHTAGLELVDSVKLKEDSGINAHYLVVRDAASLLELVQFNALEFHPWGSHAEEPDRADRVVFDLDPGPDVPFAEVKKAATDIRKLLAQLELESFLRVSGGKGLHVVVPLNPGCDWDLTKRFAKGFADALAQSEPQRFLATATKALRNKRIFVDYLRNGRGATAVASYSLRGRPGAPVAMPLAWSELPNLKRADAFTIKDVPGKLKRRRKDPWEGIDALKQNLSKWARND